MALLTMHLSTYWYLRAAFIVPDFFWRAVQKHVDFVVHSFDPKHKVKESRLKDGAVYVRWHNHRHSELRGTELTADEQNCK
jgi:hypothetical protein